MFQSIRQALNASRDETNQYLKANDYQPSVWSLKNLGVFFSDIPAVLKLIREEPEILLFTAIQWIVICLSYFAWIQMLDWIPDSIWKIAMEEENGQSISLMVNLVLFAWSLLIIILASFPIGLCNAAIVAVHNLRVSGSSSTIGKALLIAARNLGKIWVFTSIDAYVTLRIILSRLPKKNNRRPLNEEALYYAWKLATMTIVPSLVNGKGFIEASKDSILLLKTQPLRAIGLRMGYSVICWIMGILAYSAVVLFFKYFNHGLDLDTPNVIYYVYAYAAVPIVVAVAIISVVVRPFFLLGVARFYTDVINVKPETEKNMTGFSSTDNFLFSLNAFLFISLLIVLLYFLIFGEDLGISEWIENLQFGA